MKLWYYRAAEGNFGDDLNPWIWSRLLADVLDDDAREAFFGIGTVIGFDVAAEVRHVFGSGSGYREIDPGTRDTWRFHCVRGPLTAERLGLDARLAITDPAIFVRRMPLPRVPKRHRVAFMPHHVSAHYGLDRALVAAAGLHYIDPRGGVFHTLYDLAGSELVVCEAMHGAIVADALRVPWIPVKLQSWISDFKWRDWSASLGIEHRFEAPRVALFTHDLRASGRPVVGAWRWLKRRSAEIYLRQAARARPRLSDEAVSARAEARLWDALERFRRAHRRAA